MLCEICRDWPAAGARSHNDIIIFTLDLLRKFRRIHLRHGPLSTVHNQAVSAKIPTLSSGGRTIGCHWISMWSNMLPIHP
jgi:hypothetical protein